MECRTPLAFVGHGRVLAAGVCLFGIFTLGPEVAGAEERFAVVVGYNEGSVGEPPLRYAESDADKVAKILVEIGGVPQENLVLLRGGAGGDLVRSIKDTNRGIQESGSNRVSLIVYYSGHADSEYLHAAGEQIPVDQVLKLVESSPAAFKMLVLDACRSGGLTKVKGGRIVPAVRSHFEGAAMGEGMVLLAATAEDEDAQESENIRGSFFTHYLVTALMGAGDVDGDGAVDVGEAYRFAYDNTIRASSRSLLGVQHPTFRQSLKGKGKIVLTHWSDRRGRGFLRFPENEQWLLMRHSSGGAVVAEIGAVSENRVLGVGPGQYFLRGRGKAALREGVVRLQVGETIDVSTVPMVSSEYARLVRKGEHDTPRALHGLHLGYSVRSALERGAGQCHGTFVGYSIDFRAFSVLARFIACRGGFSLDEGSSASELGFEFRLARFVDFRHVTLALSVGVGPSWIALRSNTSRDFPAIRRSAVFHADAALALQREVGRGVYLGVEGAAMIYWSRRGFGERSPGASTRFLPRLGVEFGKRF